MKKNPLNLILLSAIALLICFIIINMFFFSWNWGTMKYQKSDYAKPKPTTSIELKEKENCEECEECSPCSWSDIPALPK